LDVHLGICTQRALLFRGLADACRATGCQVTWIRRVEDARPERDAAVLWDAGAGQQPDFAQLSELVAAVAPAKIIVLQGFPRFDDLQRARHHGAHHTLALPVQSPDLWSMLQHVVA
jgi:hypothetical protein